MAQHTITSLLLIIWDKDIQPICPHHSTVHSDSNDEISSKKLDFSTPFFKKVSLSFCIYQRKKISTQCFSISISHLLKHNLPQAHKYKAVALLVTSSMVIPMNREIHDLQKMLHRPVGMLNLVSSLRLQWTLIARKAASSFLPFL